MNKYEVLAIQKFEDLEFCRVSYAVAYKNLLTDADYYFIIQYDLELIASSNNDARSLLLEAAIDRGGLDLRDAMYDYFNNNLYHWDTKAFVVDIIHDEIELFGMNKKIPISSKIKVTVTDDMHHKHVHYDQGILANYPLKSSNSPEVMAKLLPGVEAKVNHPSIKINDKYSQCGLANSNNSLSWTIIHLNDLHQWTREEIADWLDEISDPTGETGPDLRFKAPVEKEQLIDSKPKIAIDYMMEKYKQQPIIEWKKYYEQD